MLKAKLLAASIAVAATLLTLHSCAGEEAQKEEHGAFVINEIMAANHAGLLEEGGRLHDWIELKNISAETASLKHYRLAVEKVGDKQMKGKEPKKKEWVFPDIEVGPGECVIVFASKKGKNEDDGKEGAQGELHANFKLSADGGKVQLLRKDEVMGEVDYGSLEDDMSYSRTDDGTFETSYEQTPGFENTAEGYERYNKLIEQQRKDALKLWEVHAKGYKSGEAWIEVKNVTDKPVDLKEYQLTTSKKNAKRWSFPSAQLQPGEVFVVDCKKVGLKIGRTKSVILLKGDKFADGICAAAAPRSASIGRVAGKDGFFYMPSPTQGSAQTAEHYRHIAVQPSFNPTPNVYAGQKSMEVRLETHGQTVHYTIDGTAPTTSSPIYKDAITISKTTTIRAFCAGDSTSMRSNTITATYILTDAHTLPVMNITVAQADLHDYHRGIYVAGPGAGAEYPHEGANYWKPWWKKANIELFDSINGGFSASCELAIFGGFSRALAKKSFKIRFKEESGPSHIDYDLYNAGKAEEVKNFVLRSGSQDYTGVMVRDEFFTSLMKPTCPTLLIQAYRPVVLYINGEYFGVYYIREKIDKRFVAHHLGVSNDSISIIMSGMYCEEGTKQDYQKFMSYVSSHDLTLKECYENVKNQFDLTGLIDFKLGQMYSCNADLGNVRYVRSKDPRGDQKWHIVYYDLDATWAQDKPAATYFGAGDNSDRVTRLQNILIQKLLKNKEFRKMFLERLSLHMHKTFSTENATAVFDNLISTIKPEMKRNCQRWPEMSYDKWESHVNAFREKFKARNKTMLNDLRKFLGITAEENRKYFADLGY